MPVTGPGSGSARTHPARLLVAASFAVAHLVAFLFLMITIPPMPASAFVDLPPPVRTSPNGGVQFDMCADCGPGFVLAGRGFGWGQPGNDNYTQAIMLANLPGRIIAGVAGAVVEGQLGRYGAMWLETCVFAIASLAQWWGLGWVISARLGTRLGVREGELRRELS